MENFKIREKITDLIEKYLKERCYEIRKEKNKIYICDSSEKYIDFHDRKFISISGDHKIEFMEISLGKDCFTVRTGAGVILRGNYIDFQKKKEHRTCIKMDESYKNFNREKWKLYKASIAK